MRERLTQFVGPVRRTGPLQSGFAQMEWLAYRSGAPGLFPNITRAVAVPDGVPDDAVSDAVGALLLRHEVLRTSFDADAGGAPRQRVYDNARAVLPVVEDGHARRRFVEAPFDPVAEPPIRFARTPDGSLLFAVAHLAADEEGAEVLAADLTELLAAHAERRAARLSPAAPQPIDRALHEQGSGRARAESSLRHWTTALRDFPVTVFPVSRGRSGADVVQADLESPAAALALASLRTTFGASPTAIFLAAACTALAIEFGRERLGLNLTWSFRELPAVREMVAAVFRDMPLLIDLRGRPSFSEVLRRVRNTILSGGRYMSFDVMEFYEHAERAAGERGGFLPGPEAINCMFDGVDLEPSGFGRDPLAVLADSRLSTGRSNEFTEICNLYLSVHPVEGRLHIYSAIDASIVDGRDGAGLVRLTEAILAHAAHTGDLTFDAAESLAADPWRPGPRWGRIDGTWVDLDFLTDRLREDPAVHRADVREEDGRVTAYVSADRQPWQLRDLLLSTDSGRSAVVSPGHFVIRQPGGRTVTGSGVERPMLAPVTAAEEALRDAVAEANALGELTMAGTYAAVGGRLHLAPRVLSLLRRAGFDGITVTHLRRPVSLVALAGRLHGAADRALNDREVSRG